MKGEVRKEEMSGKGGGGRKRREGKEREKFGVYNTTKLAHSQNKPMHRMKLSWRRKKWSGKRDREDVGGTAEEAKSWGKRE